MISSAIFDLARPALSGLFSLRLSTFHSHAAASFGDSRWPAAVARRRSRHPLRRECWLGKVLVKSNVGKGISGALDFGGF